jgi:hypothetical protein
LCLDLLHVVILPSVGDLAVVVDFKDPYGVDGDVLARHVHSVDPFDEDYGAAVAIARTS